ncbi:uncharacterized protein LOC133927597 [Phragmites australis]|uniref:uncharacterized protein LOC133927597 n=1 Tax=Phragmites australis TaxID=29695 RepID=UPI002D797FD5|nr:uncharacterized protein LOC133927597 [Phragmites australis]
MHGLCSVNKIVLCALDILFGIVPLVLMIRSLCKHPPVDVDGEQHRVLVAPDTVAPPPPAAAAAPHLRWPALTYFSYAARGRSGRASETVVCAICLDPLRHAFHRDCVRVRAWSSNSCPLCRVKIVSGSDGVAVADDMV